jgi:hypothetical protein
MSTKENSSRREVFLSPGKLAYKSPPPMHHTTTQQRELAGVLISPRRLMVQELIAFSIMKLIQTSPNRQMYSTAVHNYKVIEQ